jgi:hypothetical protein
MAKILAKSRKEVEDMRLTIEQRLQALERDVVVLQDTIKLLHKLLKDQGELIHDYITQKVAQADDNGENNSGNGRPEDALYTFVCKQRFDKIDKDIKKLRQLIQARDVGLKAG